MGKMGGTTVENENTPTYVISFGIAMNRPLLILDFLGRKRHTHLIKKSTIILKGEVSADIDPSRCHLN